MITPQPNKHINIILPHTHISRETEIIVLGEAWRLVDFDNVSVEGVSFMSFTESKVNQQRDDIENGIANIDTKADWKIEIPAQRRVLPNEVFKPTCAIYKNGVVQDAVPAISVSGNLTLLEDGSIQAGSNGSGVITVSSNGASAIQRIAIGDSQAVVITLMGDDKIRVTNSAKYEVPAYQGTIEFSIDNPQLAKIESIENNSCVLQANSNNRLGKVTLTARCGDKVVTKVIKIISLWQVI